MSAAFAPGYNPARLVRLMRDSIARCGLDLGSSVVLTEAAIGAYAVTPVLAAIAGAARVYAFTRTSRYGTIQDVTEQTYALAELAGVHGRIQIISDKTPEIVGQADIVTNSGHVRPIDRAIVDCLKRSAVVPLMYESWEYRPADVDLIACRERDIPVAGTNERHPGVDVFSYLGIMAVKLLLDAGIAVCGCRVLLLCDNPFSTFIGRGLSGAGAVVNCVPRLSEAREEEVYDAIVVALLPGKASVLGETEAERIKTTWNGAVVAQFWGDIERDALIIQGVPVWPIQPPASGHMGILPSAVGPEPVVRLQTGGLKVGELLWRARRAGHSSGQAIQLAVESGFADRLEINSTGISGP